MYCLGHSNLPTFWWREGLRQNEQAFKKYHEGNNHSRSNKQEPRRNLVYFEAKMWFSEVFTQIKITTIGHVTSLPGTGARCCGLWSRRRRRSGPGTTLSSSREIRDK